MTALKLVESIAPAVQRPLCPYCTYDAESPGTVPESARVVWRVHTPGETLRAVGRGGLAQATRTVRDGCCVPTQHAGRILREHTTSVNIHRALIEDIRHYLRQGVTGTNGGVKGRVLDGVLFRV